MEFRGLTSGHRCKHPTPRVRILSSFAKEQNCLPVRRPESITGCPIRTELTWRATLHRDDMGSWGPGIPKGEQDLLSVWRKCWTGAALDEQLRFTATERGDGVNAPAIALRTKSEPCTVGREIRHCLI